jgi:alpha-pyrone synthase
LTSQNQPTSGKVYLNQISTAVPPNDVHACFLEYARRNLDERSRPLFDRLARKSQIQHRYSFFSPRIAETSELMIASSRGLEAGKISTNDDAEIPKSEHREDTLDADGFFKPGAFPSTHERMVFFEKNVMRLADLALEPVFKKHQPESFTHLIVTNCTGLMAPGLDLLVQKRWEMRQNLERTNIFFMGCYAAFNGLKTARHIVRSQSNAKVLVLSLEMCTLHLQESFQLEDLMGFLQFSDGCGAAVVSSDQFGLSLDHFESSLVPEARDLITWRIGDRGFDMFLSMDVPKVLGEKLPTFWKNIWNREQRPEIVAIHPGGRAILDVVQEKLGFSDGQMHSSREVLKNYGNMSSATILFVLADILKQSQLHGDGIAMAFGPGLTVESLRFSKEIG